MVIAKEILHPLMFRGFPDCFMTTMFGIQVWLFWVKFRIRIYEAPPSWSPLLMILMSYVKFYPFRWHNAGMVWNTELPLSPRNKISPENDKMSDP